jgi:hypothetical protein
MAEAKISKWQKKSNQVNDIRWAVEKILSEDLTEEEKQSTKYQELLQSARVAFEHASPDLTPKKALSRIWLAAIATSSGAVLVELIRLVNTFFGGQP